MAQLVNLTFGGEVAASWATIEEVALAYKTLADNHDLIKRRYGFSLLWDDAGELVGAEFWYEKHDLLEANLQVFLDTWQALALANGIIRYPTTVQYFESE